MNKYLWLLCCGILTCCTRPAAAQKNPADHSLLWKIAKPGYPASYLFGTMHMLCKTDYVWTDAMQQSLDKAACVCFEMDMDDPSLLMQTTLGLIDTSGKKLSDYFTEEQYARLKKYMRDSFGTDLSQFEKMKPFVLQTLFMPAMAHCDSMVSYEETIMKAAQKAGKEIIGLETASEQLALVDHIPSDSIIKEIIEGMDEPAQESGEYAEMIRAYKAQNLPELYRIILSAPELMNISAPLLDERNRKWIGRMERMMKDRSVFFAVGAGHLWGENGVIQLLRKQGYSVTAVQ